MKQARDQVIQTRSTRARVSEREREKRVLGEEYVRAVTPGYPLLLPSIANHYDHDHHYPRTASPQSILLIIHPPQKARQKS